MAWCLSSGRCGQDRQGDDDHLAGFGDARGRGGMRRVSVMRALSLSVSGAIISITPVGGELAVDLFFCASCR